MNEEGQVKKQLRKNMVLNFITFSIILSIFGTFIYSKFYNSLYISADSELKNAIHQNDIHRMDIPKKNIPKGEELKGDEQKEENFEPNDIEEIENNPRLIYIKRNEDGNVIENQTLNSIFTDIGFDSGDINTIYEVTINNEYSYRGINIKTSDGGYKQILINVDAEKDIASKFKKTLVIAIIICVILIVIASYILSKRTLKPIVDSWKKQTEFVQDASHELRTPLTIIKAKQEKLLENPNTTILDNAEDISITLKETQRLTKLVKELMDLARSDSKEMSINKEIFNLDNEIAEISSLYIDVANSQNKNLSLNLNYKDEINADINKIKELLVILLDNGLKYTEQGDTIEVKTCKKDGKAIIEVIDSGIGISEEDAEHIFERFYRAEKSRNRASGGMGLGLSIAYNIVKIHKGTIKIDKNVEKGSKFIIKLPVK